MAQETEKPLVDQFEQAQSVSTAASQLEAENPPPHLSERYAAFYGAVFNALTSLFINSYAKDIPVNKFPMGYESSDKGFAFYLVPQPDRHHHVSVLNEYALNFLSNIGNVTNDQELESVTARQSEDPTRPGFTLIVRNPSDLVDMMDGLLADYDIRVGTYFNAEAFPKAHTKQVPFALSPLYSIEHIHALYRHAQGQNCSGLGLQLSH